MKVKRRVDTRIEILRVLGALSVFAYHFAGDAESVTGSVVAGGSLWAAVQKGSGPFGVALFIIISGIVLTWSWSRVSSPAAFVRRRLGALFSLYWWVAVPLIALALVADRMPIEDLWKVPLWLSGLGILSSTTFFPVVDGWWYMTLAVQLVLLYPMLRRVQDRLGLEGFVLGSALVTVFSGWALTAAGLSYAIDGFAGSRLMEFAIGMTMGRCLREETRGWPPASVVVSIVVGLGVCVLGSPGAPLRMVVAPAVVLLVVGTTRNAAGMFGRWIAVAGGLTYAFYLVHSPWAKPILAALTSLPLPLRVAVGCVLSLAVSASLAWGFQRSLLWTRGRLKRGSA